MRITSITVGPYDPARAALLRNHVNTKGFDPMSNQATQPVCALCGEPMPAGQEMFKFHGFDGTDCDPAKVAAFKARQNAAPVVGGWIATADRMPDPETDVLIIRNTTKGPKVTGATYRRSGNQPGFGVWDNEAWPCAIAERSGEVAWWQPAPALPNPLSGERETNPTPPKDVAIDGEGQ